MGIAAPRKARKPSSCPALIRRKPSCNDSGNPPPAGKRPWPSTLPSQRTTLRSHARPLPDLFRAAGHPARALRRPQRDPDGRHGGYAGGAPPERPDPYNGTDKRSLSFRITRIFGVREDRARGSSPMSNGTQQFYAATARSGLSGSTTMSDRLHCSVKAVFAGVSCRNLLWHPLHI